MPQPRLPRASKALGRTPSMPRTVRPPRGGLGFSMPTVRSNAAVDFGQAIADQLLAGLQQNVVLDLPITTPVPDQPEGDDVRPTVGSVLHYTPDSRGWLANLSDEEGSEWQEIVVGWAVVVTWASYAPDSEESQREEGDESEFQSEIQPALFSTESGNVELMLFREGVTLDGLVLPGVPT